MKLVVYLNLWQVTKLSSHVFEQTILAERRETRTQCFKLAKIANDRTSLRVHWRTRANRPRFDLESGDSVRAKTMGSDRLSIRHSLQRYEGSLDFN